VVVVRVEVLVVVEVRVVVEVPVVVLVVVALQNRYQPQYRFSDWQDLGQRKKAA
jgi:hypothetical protein